MITPYKQLADWDTAFERGGASALLEQYQPNPEQLNEFMLFRASGGGTGWPAELVKYGADPNYCDDEGCTSLSQCIHSAAVAPKVETFETAIELLAVGASPNQLYSSICSVTSLAVRFNKSEFVALFLMSGADLDAIEPDDGCTLRELLANSDRSWARHMLRLVAR
jgi:hypothetical protein